MRRGPLLEHGEDGKAVRATLQAWADHVSATPTRRRTWCRLRREAIWSSEVWLPRQNVDQQRHDADYSKDEENEGIVEHGARYSQGRAISKREMCGTVRRFSGTW